MHFILFYLYCNLKKSIIIIQYSTLYCIPLITKKERFEFAEENISIYSTDVMLPIKMFCNFWIVLYLILLFFCDLLKFVNHTDILNVSQKNLIFGKYM